MTSAEYATRMRALKWWTLVYVSWFAGCFGAALLLFDRTSAVPDAVQLGVGLAIGAVGLAVASAVERWIIRRGVR